MQVQEQLRERGSPEPEPDSVQSEADELGIQNSSGLAESEPEDEPNFSRRTRQRMSGVASFLEMRAMLISWREKDMREQMPDLQLSPNGDMCYKGKVSFTNEPLSGYVSIFSQ